VARDGAVWDQPMEAFHSPYPDAALLQAVDKIGILNQAETAQVNWAVNNRQDSRKTATEVQTSAKQQTALSGVEVLMFSLTLSRVLNYAWQIVRSAAQNGMIKFMPDASGQNNARALSFEYQIKPAGDIDWVERQENVSRMQEDWPVIQSTPMRDMFLEDYVRMRYPQSAEKYIAVLRQGALAPQLAEALKKTMAVAQAALVDPATQQLKSDYAEQAPQLMQLAQQNMQLIQQAQAAQGTQPTQNQTRQQLP
jgi:hypothetical protein